LVLVKDIVLYCIIHTAITSKTELNTTGRVKQWQFIYNLDDHMAVVHMLVGHKHPAKHTNIAIKVAATITYHAVKL